MKANVFEYLSYRQYLKDCLESQGLKSGLKRRASETLSVHTTFISQVVLGKADLSLDQGERMNIFLNHSEEEGEFFLDLLICERASEPKLKKRFENKIKSKHLERAQINKRLEKTKELAPSDQEKFYSSHLYGLLHVLASIPEFRSRENLSAAVGVSQKIANEAIDFLLKIGVLKLVKDQIIPGEQHIHLGNQSKNIWRHHTNWRLATLQHLDFGEASDLHYSLTFSCSKRDAIKLREGLLAHLKSMSEIIGISKEEDAYVYCFDFFKWK